MKGEWEWWKYIQKSPLINSKVCVKFQIIQLIIKLKLEIVIYIYIYEQIVINHM